VVEYGPGVGNISQEVLARLAPDAHLILIELNEDFADFLREQLRDPRVHVVRASAEDVRRILEDLGLGSADYIISGIPYSTMPPEARRRVLAESRSANTVLPHLRVVFRSIRQDFELLNILPARLFYCSP
jgi:phospholipid N-methyltransferase